MLTTYFKHPFTLDKLHSGPAGPHMDDFACQLTREGYSYSTARRHLRGAGQLSIWAQTAGLTTKELEAGALERFRRYLASRGKLHTQAGLYLPAFVGARLFIAFLQTRGIVATSPPSPAQAPPALLIAFEHWMRTHRGVTGFTLKGYRPVLGAMLHTLGEQPEQYSAKTLRDFALDRASRHGHSQACIVLSAMRMFLRFLSTHGHCAAELIEAIPAIAGWRQAALPYALSAPELEGVLTVCDITTAIGSRDQAILLLLARLGLRAGDVAALTLSDIDWHQGTLRVCGKSRQAAQLPLPQDAGEAILHYLSHHRPAVAIGQVFITAVGPWRPIPRDLVGAVVARALRRASIEAPAKGAHLLRHSAATAMLRQGLPLETIGAVLRHRSIETTSGYTKIDTELLAQVIQPWLEVEAC